MATIELPKSILEAIDSAIGTPRLIDPRTNQEYVLVTADEFKALQDDADDEREQRAIARIAFKTAVKRLKEDA